MLGLKCNTGLLHKFRTNGLITLRAKLYYISDHLLHLKLLKGNDDDGDGDGDGDV